MRYPEYGQDDRLMLHRINYEKGTIDYFGTEYPLKDTNFPTVDPQDPYKLSEGEETLMETLTYSFLHSKRLQKHMRYIYSHGSMYKVCNNNLLFQGLHHFDGQGQHKAHGDGLQQPGLFAGQRIKQAQGHEHQDVADLLARQPPQEGRHQPGQAAAVRGQQAHAALGVEDEAVPEDADAVHGKDQAQQSRQIADEQAGKHCPPPRR